ncbi:unnamed protein product [Arctia plantaginis]|uniref:Uncharacterized protein n=1 Tax=Arctia plantaginis TaxID=874455 RepID=A0A8S1AZF8_ARCPL|nr:unnamed protein product [Arctia plantaginis]
MSTIDTLPVLLVSTVNETVATTLILELIDNDVTEEYRKEIESPDRVWRLDNKYYSADVRVHILTDGEVLAINPNSVEAHIIYITEDEVSEECTERAARRAGACCDAWEQCHVRVLMADCIDHEPLEAWAVAQHADFVPRLEEAQGQADEPFADAYGLERARATLHAHAWSNLQRKEARFSTSLPPLNGTEGENESGASSESELAWEGCASDEEVRAVERAEAFAAALGALSAASPPPAHPALPRPERLQRAEDLVTAFCRALGLDPDTA